MALPVYQASAAPVFSWGAYVEVVHWSPNLFFIPSGTVGSAFVGELSRLFKAFVAASALEAVSIMAATALPIVYYFFKYLHATT